MKRIIALLIIFIIFFIPLNINAESYNSVYENFLSDSEKFTSQEFGLNEGKININKLVSKFINLAAREFAGNFKALLKTFCFILAIIVFSSIVNCFVTSESVAESVKFSCYVFCSLLIIKIFAEIAKIGTEGIHNVREYMNIAFPGYITLLAGSGYGSSATTLRGIFIVISNVITVLIDNIIVPVLYISAIMGISSGVSKSNEINKIAKFTIKSVRYFIGIMLTIFSSVIAFAGFASSATDGIAIKTAKYAITNFVPIVGNCLADTLNSLIYTTLLLKNTAGYIGVFIILFIAISPIIKFFMASIMFKYLSLITSLLTDKEMSDIMETSGSVLTTFGSLLIFLSAIYVLIFGVIASLGA